jgi:hypothetical protein
VIPFLRHLCSLHETALGDRRSRRFVRPLLALVDDFGPTAVEERDARVRIFFPPPPNATPRSGRWRLN